MTSILGKVVIALLFSANFLSADLFKITLQSGDELTNCKNLKTEDDSLHISLLVDDSLNKTLQIESIRSIVRMSDSFVTKYDFADMSRIQKIGALNEIIEPSIPVVPESYSVGGLRIILIGLVTLLLIGTGAVLIMKLTRKKRLDEEVPGAKEMVKTMLFWAKRHRDEVSKY